MNVNPLNFFKVKPPNYVSNFDSATTMLRATARYLKGKDFPAQGLGAPLKYPASVANTIPRQLREVGYAVGGFNEAIRPAMIGRVRAEKVANWVTGLYPPRQYPAVMVGSSSGALVHLAALGTPWLPQTVFIPVRQPNVHVDDARGGLEKGLKPGRKLLDANPELQLHHMHDPNQDRLMLTGMTYFRVKWRRLAEHYRRFMVDALPRGATVYMVECQRTWPVTQVGDRHFYQFGALGGATEQEFFEGSPRVAEYLERYDAPVRRWDPPEPTGQFPEAEWGFEPAIRESIDELADERAGRSAGSCSRSLRR